jgi:hypothetical protein
VIDVMHFFFWHQRAADDFGHHHAMLQAVAITIGHRMVIADAAPHVKTRTRYKTALPRRVLVAQERHPVFGVARPGAEMKTVPTNHIGSTHYSRAACMARDTLGWFDLGDHLSILRPAKRSRCSFTRKGETICWAESLR